MKYVIAELSDDNKVISIEESIDYRKMLIYIDKYSKDEGGVYMCEDHIEHSEIIMDKNGIIHWTDKNTLLKFCLVDIDYPFENDFRDINYESVGYRIFKQIKPLLRDLKINEILSISL